MKRKQFIFNIIVLSISLMTISFIYILINGRTYTLDINVGKDVVSPDQVNIQIQQNNDKEIIRCIDEKLENGVLKLKYEGINEGKAFVEYPVNEDTYTMFILYVHKFGIITNNNYFGKANGSTIIPISISIILIYIIYILIKQYRKHVKEELYQYKNIVYLGLIIFLSFFTLVEILSINNYYGIINTVNSILGNFGFFSIIMLPIAFVVSILIAISNIVLIKKEGFNLKNLLGIFLGIFLCVTTMIPEILNNILQSSTFIDVHNAEGIGTHLFLLIETTIYIVVAYLECILLGTIILSIKAARHVPEPNKDYILVLGCKIKKDGTLTNILKLRVDRAIEFAKIQKDKTGKDIIFVPSGGQGEDEIISEAQAMKNYLITNGISENNILLEDKSKNTFENIKFSNKIIKEKNKDAKIAFSTTNYHVFRAGIIANEQNIKMEGIGSKTKSYFWINAFIREFIATLYSEKKKHFIAILSILIMTIIMILIVYYSNIM